MEVKTDDTYSPERAPALEANTMCEAFALTVREFGDWTALRTKGGEFSCTWNEYDGHVRALAGGFAGLGLERGQNLALMLSNRPEFHFADTAGMSLGATTFSIYNTYSAEQVAHLLGDSEARIVVTEKQFVDRVLEATGIAGSVEHVVLVDGDHEGTLSLEAVAAAAEDGFDFDAVAASVKPEDIINLIYTSGTTGPPKGVQLAHSNLIAAVRSSDEVIGFGTGGRLVSYLPMAHVAERNISHYLPMLCAFSVTSCPDAREVISYLPEVRPTWFFAVPRIFEKVKAGLEATLSGIEDPEQKERVATALEKSLERVRLIQAGEPVPDELQAEWERLDAELFSGLRTMLGLDRVSSCVVGAAPTPRDVLEFFHALGIRLAETWGMSETTGAGTCNPPERIKIGTVGPPVKNVELKLADDGELLVKGPVVMVGYRNLPDQTAEAMTDDGWLRTGDIGEIDEDGYLSIIDRKKELIINAAGKNMSPANIESELKSAGPLIGQAVAIGDRRPYNVALVTLDPDALPGFCKEHGLDPSDRGALGSDEKIREQLQSEVDAANAKLARVEQIKKFQILTEEWLPGGDELTPTMKLKRKPIAEKYADEIEALYA